jgi:hypothetical protein
LALAVSKDREKRDLLVHSFIISRGKTDWSNQSWKPFLCIGTFLVFITKNILNRIQKKCFSFLWTREKKEGITLVKWNPLAKPKKLVEVGD